MKAGLGNKPCLLVVGMAASGAGALSPSLELKLNQPQEFNAAGQKIRIDAASAETRFPAFRAVPQTAAPAILTWFERRLR